MAPSHTADENPAAAAATMKAEQRQLSPREEEMQEIALQPMVAQPMNPDRPHEESQQTGLRLRGGDRGGCCPGRFCFCIPCPLPCDFCII